MDFYSAYSDTVKPLPFHSMGKYPYDPETRYPMDALHLAYRLDNSVNCLRRIVGTEPQESETTLNTVSTSIAPWTDTVVSIGTFPWQRFVSNTCPVTLHRAVLRLTGSRWR